MIFFSVSDILKHNKQEKNGIIYYIDPQVEIYRCTNVLLVKLKIFILIWLPQEFDSS